MIYFLQSTNMLSVYSSALQGIIKINYASISPLCITGYHNDQTVMHLICSIN